MAFEFLRVKAGGIDFSKGIISTHPELATSLDKNEHDQKEIIGRYFDAFYNSNYRDITSHLKRTTEAWASDEPKFNQQLEILFKNPPIPEGKYIGYLSIINCNPRFLEDKTFQVFYTHPSGSNFVTAHEVLHFFFYDYADRNYPEMFGKLDKDLGIYWDMAELFNNVVMADPNFISGSYSKHVKPYPNHFQHFDEVKAIWEKSHDIDKWLTETHEYLTTRP